MKDSISIPDDLFEAANAFAERTHQSPNEVVANAVRYYLAINDAGQVTEALNKAVAEVGQVDLTFLNAAAQRILERSDW